MLATIGVIAFIFGILFSIAWHELGHLLPAKRFGVKVTQYMVGFGPTMWSRRRGETEYGIKWIPFGGYIRMIGMFPPGPDGVVRASSTGRLGTLVEEARQQSAAEVVTEADKKRAFYALSVPKKLVIMLGGPVMNLILAFALFALLFVGIGVPTPTLTVSAVTACVPTAGAEAGDAPCPADSAPTAAAEAGIESGDTIRAYQGTQLTDWDQFVELVRTSAAGPATVTFERGNELITRTTTIAVIERPVVVDGQLTDLVAPQGFFGVTPERQLQRQSPGTVVVQMWDMTKRAVGAIITIPVKMVGVAEAAFSSAERDPEGPVGVVGVTRISGEVAASELPESWKIGQFIALLASLNLFLFLFNLIPLLPLDGGHVAGALWEGARRRWARWKGRPDPGPVDVARALPLAYGVAIILIGMSILLVYADIVDPIRLF